MIVKLHISKCIVSGLQQPAKPLATVLISYHPSPDSLDLLLQIRVHAFCRSRCRLLANFFYRCMYMVLFTVYFACETWVKAAYSIRSKDRVILFICCAFDYEYIYSRRLANKKGLLGS